MQVPINELKFSLLEVKISNNHKSRYNKILQNYCRQTVRDKKTQIKIILQKDLSSVHLPITNLIISSFKVNAQHHIRIERIERNLSKAISISFCEPSPILRKNPRMFKKNWIISTLLLWDKVLSSMQTGVREWLPPRLRYVLDSLTRLPHVI